MGLGLITKTSLIIVCVFVSLFWASPQASADDFDMQASDKQMHIAGSYGGALTSTLIFEKHEVPRWKAIVYGSLVALSLGLTKEYLIDQSPSTGDLLADGIGTGLSAAIVLGFEL